MNEAKKKPQKKANSRLFWILLILFSIVVHIGLLYRLGKYSKSALEENPSLPEDYVKLDIRDHDEVKKDEPLQTPDEKQKRILETPLLPTQKPPDADFLGQNDHQAKKLMKVKRKDHEKAADAGLAKPNQKSVEKQSPWPPLQTKQEKRGKDVEVDGKEHDVKPLAKEGFTEQEPKQLKGRNGYENLLAESAEKVAPSEMHQGYVDYLNDLMEEGETLDLNTQEYRFIGYFTGLRKAIELVWVYPSEAAQRGLHGQVLVKFVISSNGKVPKVQVVQSSGYNILDQAIVDAIRMASPFAPLPKGFQKDHLVVKGAFTYILGNY